MSRPILLIVDGESLRTPGLESALEVDGWVSRWIKGREVTTFLESGLMPDLLLLDAPPPDAPGYVLARALRARNARLPLLVVSDEGSVGHGSVGVEVQAYAERGRSAGELVGALRRFRPEPEQEGLTADAIFGDLLADLEGAPRPPQDPFAMFPGDAVPPSPPLVLSAPSANIQPVSLPQGKFSTEDIFGEVLEEVEALPRIVPDRANLPVPMVKAVAPMASPAVPTPAALPAPPVPPPPVVVTPLVPPPVVARPPVLRPVSLPPVQALAPSDFTLSGISGVHDPFSRAPAAEPLSKPPASRSAAQAEKNAPSGSSKAIEEYGNYFLLEKIAVGGMAELFKAQQRGVQGFQKIVAIKRILPHFSDNEDFVTMFIDEAKLAAQLTHPNIVQIFDLGKAGNSYYIAMEYVNGRDLRTLLRKTREYGIAFPEQVAAFVVMKVASALDYAHRKRGFDDRELKLVHRDISPQNVLLSTDGAVKLVDFGIAKAASKASHTVAGALKGKLLYMSPEQATGQPLDNRSDLYSLGLVLYELLTGERCFQADSELGVLEKVRLGRISDLATVNPNVSREMVAIVNRALQKGVDHRYPSARFLERDLRDYLQRQGAPPTEHDVAEFMNTLLNSPREDLDTLLASRFPAPVPSLTSGAHRLGEAAVTATGTIPRDLNPRADLTLTNNAPLEQLPRAPSMQQLEPDRPKWLLPAILVLAMILVIMLVVAVWS